MVNGLARWTNRTMTTMKSAPRKKPTSGETTMNTTTFTSPAGSRTPTPAFATPAPARPAMSACEELDGSP